MPKSIFMKKSDKSQQVNTPDELTPDENIILDAMGLSASSRRKFLRQVSTGS